MNLLSQNLLRELFEVTNFATQTNFFCVCENWGLFHSNSRAQDTYVVP